MHSKITKEIYELKENHLMLKQPMRIQQEDSPFDNYQSMNDEDVNYLNLDDREKEVEQVLLDEVIDVSA